MSSEGPDQGGEMGGSATDRRWGSDHVVDLLEAFGHEIVAFNPGASFRGIEESIVNYNDETPEIVETPNESLSVSIAHGYAKATGNPGLCILHNVVGTLNAAMAIYNAYIDRVPIVMLSATGPLQKSQRRPWIDWIHSANVQGNLVRDYVKWDDQPEHVDGVAESLLRAHEIANTRPEGPTYVTIKSEIQESPLPDDVTLPDLSEYTQPSGMAPDPGQLATIADELVAAEFPVVLVDCLGDSPRAVDALVELADRLGTPVIDIDRRRFNFPNTHPMYLAETQVYERADLILAADVLEMDRVTPERMTALSDVIEPDTTVIDIGTHELEASGLFPNTYSKHRIDYPVLADTDVAIPILRDAVIDRLDADPDAAARARERFEEVASLHADRRSAWWDEAEQYWDDQPIAPARLAGEIWNLIEEEEWVLVGDMFPRWTDRLWDIEEYDQYVGGYTAGGGIGYGIGAAIGGALAYRDTDRVPINIQPDGDLMQFLSGLWVIGNWELPMLTVMYNNRSMHNSTNHRMTVAEHRGRDASYEKALIGTGYRDPAPNYATVAEGLGVEGFGPVEDPANLAPTLAAAWESVMAGRPALVDVICRPD